MTSNTERPDDIKKQYEISEPISQEKNEKSDELGEYDQSEERSELTTKIVQLEDTLLRTRADNENLRKRYVKEIEDTQKYAISNFAMDISDVMENLYHAQMHIKKEEDLEHKINSLIDGTNLIIKSLEKTLEKYNIKRIVPIKGEVFDHSLQQAISSIETSDQESNTVYEIIRAGYMIEDRLLKPALVMVAKNVGNATASEKS